MGQHNRSGGREGREQEEGAVTAGMGAGNGGDGRDGMDGMDGMEGQAEPNPLQVKVPIETDARELTGNVGEGLLGDQRKRSYKELLEEGGWNAWPKQAQIAKCKEIFERHIVMEVLVLQRMSSLINDEDLDTFQSMVADLTANWEDAEKVVKETL